MPALASDLRKSLETAVVKARELAERGAMEALATLDVGGNSHITSMTAEQERLRRRLRAHGRQLGISAIRRRARRASSAWCARWPMSTGTACCLPASWRRTSC
jgi:hypothetical protein